MLTHTHHYRRLSAGWEPPDQLPNHAEDPHSCAFPPAPVGRRKGKAYTQVCRALRCGQAGWLRLRQCEDTCEPALAGGMGTWG